MYKFQQTQSFSVSKEKLWNFVSTPVNLDELTPDDLSFEIVTELPDMMYNGMTIEYRIKLPVLGWRRWLTEIKHIEPGVRFVDEQRVGPYKLWYHTHEIKTDPSDAERNLMMDTVYYQMPYGLIGTLGHPLVRQKLEAIFKFRRKKLEAIFG